MTAPPSPLDASKAPAPNHQARGLRDAARQMEGVFVSMMFEEMAKGLNEEGGLLPKAAGRDMYHQWFRTEVAAQFAKSGGFGLGDAIARQLGATDSSSSSTRPTAVREPSKLRRRGDPNVALRGPVSAGGRRAPPVAGPVTSSFGPRVHPVTGHPGFHAGVDIAAASGVSVRNPYAGRVSKVARDARLGLYVSVTHRGGYKTLYGHLSDVKVRVGQELPAYRVVGSVGRSGRTTGAHLHFGLYRHGRPVDPALWVRVGDAARPHQRANESTTPTTKK